MGPHVTGTRQLQQFHEITALVHDDHLGGRQCREELHRHVPGAAGADDDRRRAGDQRGQRPLDRVVRREAGVGQGAALTGSKSASGTTQRA